MFLVAAPGLGLTPARDKAAALITDHRPASTGYREEWPQPVEDQLIQARSGREGHNYNGALSLALECNNHTIAMGLVGKA